MSGNSEGSRHVHAIAPAVGSVAWGASEVRLQPGEAVVYQADLLDAQSGRTVAALTGSAAPGVSAVVRFSPAAVAAVNPMGNLPDRIAQLEGQPPVRQPLRGWLLAGATVANLAGLSAAAICCTGLGVAMVEGMT